MKTEEIYKENAKKDIINFFQDTDKKHWIYNYKNNKNAKVDNKSVFYKTQLKVLFEDRYFHWITDLALKELIGEGELLQENDDKSNLVFVRYHKVRYTLRWKKHLRTNVLFLSSDRVHKHVGSYAEHLTEFMLYRLGFKIEDTHTNEYNSKKWKKSDHNLDFIASKDGLTYGIEVKNALEYIPRSEFQIKMFEMCPFLNIIPVCVLRFAPYSYINEIKEYGGFILIFKSKIFPLGYEERVNQLWNYTLLPVTTSTRFSTKIENRFKKFHEENLQKCEIKDRHH
ncbi:MAG: hypothetical protein ACTSRA_21560 [Promethearchaeota archaeon]